MIVTYQNGEYYAKNGYRNSSFIRYYVHTSIEEKENNFLLTMQPTEKEVGEGRDPLGTPYGLPSFSVDDLFRYLSKTEVTFKTEIDSTYNSESIYANFKRLLHGKSYKDGFRDPVTGKIYQESFLMPMTNNSKAELFVEVYPYRNGTKSVITVHLPVLEESYSKHVNIENAINNVIRKITEIVKS